MHRQNIMGEKTAQQRLALAGQGLDKIGRGRPRLARAGLGSRPRLGRVAHGRPKLEQSWPGQGKPGAGTATLKEKNKQKTETTTKPQKTTSEPPSFA